MTQNLERSRQLLDEEAALWCMRLAEGQLESEEQRAFEEWISAPGHTEALEDAIKVWGAADQAMHTPEMIRIRAGSFEHFRRVQRGRWSRRVGEQWHWPAAVAASVLILLLGFALFHDPVTVYRTELGERHVAMLDDGSRISLDADTEIEVRLRRDRRALLLRHGRAKFDVARDPLRPFSVTAGDKVIVATGTSFSVELLRRQARILLYEGQVAVINRNDKHVPGRLAHGAIGPADRLLTPGHELVVDLDAPAAQAVVQTVNPAHARSWEGGQLSFEDEPLPMAVERMNRYLTQKIVLEDAGTASLRINGIFEAGNVDAFIEAITANGDVSVRHQGDKLLLRRN